MKKIYSYTMLGIILLGLFGLISCENGKNSNKSQIAVKTIYPVVIKVEAENFTQSSSPFEINNLDSSLVYVEANSDGWIAIDVNIEIAGKYQSQIQISDDSAKFVTCWIEDYSDNKDDRAINITGNISSTENSTGFKTIGKDGSPLNSGLHKMKVHFNQSTNIDWIKFKLLKKHNITPVTLTQRTDGDKWQLIWSDEFTSPNIDTNKWTYDFGDWGWGDNELQYYTVGRAENARIENGNLIIEAKKDALGEKWTSARLTTHGKVSFLYGKIEFCAKLPFGNGNWAAGWTLGDEYVDELSRPSCGEIDILESVGYEMDDITGNGIAHASTHSGSYYFKPGNHAKGLIDVTNMNDEFHTYSVEWRPKGIKGFVDDRLYVAYNDSSTDLSWPFSKPQNILLNLAMGGDWGGANGIDENINSQKMIIDYVRVYELR